MLTSTRAATTGPVAQTTPENGLTASTSSSSIESDSSLSDQPAEDDLELTEFDMWLKKAMFEGSLPKLKHSFEYRTGDCWYTNEPEKEGFMYQGQMGQDSGYFVTNGDKVLKLDLHKKYDQDLFLKDVRSLFPGLDTEGMHLMILSSSRDDHGYLEAVCIRTGQTPDDMLYRVEAYSSAEVCLFKGVLNGKKQTLGEYFCESSD